MGSHFEKQACGNEMMVADSSLMSVFSRMTLAVAMDSGWYEIDLDSAEQYDWGRERGCKMLDLSYFDPEEEDPIDEFCEYLQKTSCSWNSRYINKCKRNPFSEENYLNVNYKSCLVSKLRNKFSQFHFQNESICLKMRVDFCDVF